MTYKTFSDLQWKPHRLAIEAQKTGLLSENRYAEHAAEAARFFNVKPPSIWLALKKPNRTSCGCHWKYIDGDWKDSLMECGDHIADASKMVADIKK